MSLLFRRDSPSRSRRQDKKRFISTNNPIHDMDKYYKRYTKPEKHFMPE